MKKIKTLNEFIVDTQNSFPYATGELSKLLSSICLAAKVVNKEVNKAGLVDILGKQGSTNIQGEEQQKLDVFANNQFINALRQGGEVCGVASEENETYIDFAQENCDSGKYVVLIDPLDGSSNVDVNVSIGTIFSIYKRISEKGSLHKNDFLQKGAQQIVSGYIIYGSSTMLVYSTGNGVNGFTLDPSIGVFCLSHPNLKIPEEGKILSINEGNSNQFSKGIKRYIDYCKNQDEVTNRPYSQRYIGSLVADFHRNLIKGGVFIYPATSKSPKGKLRLLYECNPMAMLIEQAGGLASDGSDNILNIEPTTLHQRVPLIIGSKQMVLKALELINA